MHRLKTIAFLATGIFLCGAWFVAPHGNSEDPVRSATKKNAEQLKPFNSLIGSWRGVGQLQRGSRSGAWTETVECQWNFDNGEASVVVSAEDSEQFATLKLRWDAKSDELVLQQKSAEGIREYRGAMPDKWPDRLQLVTSADADGVAYRCTIQQLNDIRSTLLFEKQTSPTGSFRRVAGIGYTRAGARLAVAGGNQRKCIVTGGLGTIPVSYKGETFYVCCQGCVQAFNDSPAEIIAEYRASLKKE